jgi:type I restriction enzyme S subunit
MTQAAKKLREVSTVVMGTSPKGYTYNSSGDGLPLLNGPTEFGEQHPSCTLFTTNSVKECEPGDLIFCVRGSTTGRMNWADRKYSLGRGVCAIRGESEFDTKFIRYCIDHRLDALLQLAGGTTFPNLTQDVIKDFEIPFPQSRTRIASVLSAYDDLIENNRRRMALLEESARLLYQEWFVRLRFPGHEHVRVIDGVPEGWARITLGDLCQIRRGASPRPIQAFMGGTVPWFKIGDATNSSSMYVFSTDEHVTEEGAKKSVLLGPGELIISNSATCGLPYFTGVTGCIHDGWLLLTPSSFASRALLYLCLKTKREELVNSVSDGSTQKNLNTDAASRLPLVFPKSDSLTREFDTNVQPIFNQINTLARCNDGARVARDLLLPRLMSGEVVV